MDIPSLFMIPSAVSSGKVHSVFPNSTDADFDFNRDSDATRVNSEGLIERVGFYGSELVSNGNFTNGSTDWLADDSTLDTSNETGKVTVTANTTAGIKTNTTINLVQTKKYRLRFDVLSCSGGLVSGDVKEYSSSYVAGSWNGVGTYEFFFTYQSTSAQLRWLSSANIGDVLEIDNVSVVEVTGDRARLNYEIEGGLVNTKPSLLLEPQSTNLVTYSEDFSQSSWSKFRVTLTGGFASPDGLNNAYKFVSNTETGTHYIADSTTNSGSASSISFFIKQKGQTIAGVGHGIGGSEIAYFDLANGVTLTKGSSVTSSTMKEYPNGWYKCSITFTSVSNPRYAIVFGTNADNTNSYAGDGVNGILIYGSQYEVLSYPTSYIPTNGSTQTRSGETCTGAGTSSILPSEEGILYGEIASLSDSITTAVFSISNASSANTLYMGFPNTTNVIQAQLVVGGVAQTNMNHTVSDRTSFNKVAVLFRNNNHKMFIGGVEVETDTSGSTFSAGTLDRINFDLGQGSFDFYGKIRDIRVYNTKEMTDSEVDILLTKITS